MLIAKDYVGGSTGYTVMPWKLSFVIIRHTKTTALFRATQLFLKREHLTIVLIVHIIKIIKTLSILNSKTHIYEKMYRADCNEVM